MEDPVPREEKSRWFAELLKVQEEVAARRSAAMVGNTYRVLVEERSEKSGLLCGRTPSFVVVEFPGEDGLLGQYAQVKVTAARSWQLSGELA